MEIARLTPGDALAFREDLGIREPCLERILRVSHELLGLSVFLTVGESEARAWAIPSRCTALRAAGTIHSDLERGFIHAEVISFEKQIEAETLATAREKGWIRSEGKD